MTSPSEIAIDHHMTAEDADMPERIPDPVGPLTENPQPAFPAVIWQPGAAAASGPAEEPQVASGSDAERSMPLTVPDAKPEPVPESPVGSVAASPSMRWHEILAMFVDDPRSSAQLAAGLVDDSIQTLISSLKEQQDSLLAAWHDEDAGTEECALPSSITTRSEAVSQTQTSGSRSLIVVKSGVAPRAGR
jgi:hypothetical protein